MNDIFATELVALLPRLRRFAISLTGSRQKADDLVQTACAKALSAKNSYAAGTRFDAWMFRIVRNSWIDGLRRVKIEGPETDISDHEDAAKTDGEAAVVAKLTLAKVMEAVSQLPDDQREIIILVCVEEFTYAEVAKMLDIPIGTVMSRLARARNKVIVMTGIDGKAAR